MDKIHAIKKLARQGYSSRKIARRVHCSRGSAIKYSRQEISIDPGFKRRRETKLGTVTVLIENLLASENSLKSPKHKLTARRIHSLIEEGKLPGQTEPVNVSIRTVERVVRNLRLKLHNQRYGEQHLKLTHAPGQAQIDFGEVVLLTKEEGEVKHSILVMTFPHSNYRLAYLLPGQNFECLAHGLMGMFKHINGVPVSLLCDNMSTAVAKIICREDIAEGECNNDPLDHPRKLTENFLAFMMHCAFEAHFCNPASGNEKGSVENAVGWFRRNYFVPLKSFDGNYDEFNKELLKFCDRESEKKHYRLKNRTIRELFKEDRSVLLSLPQTPFKAFTVEKRTVSETARVTIGTNEYQVDAPAGTKVVVHKRWDILEFYPEDGSEKPITTHRRCYGRGKDVIDWKVELGLLQDRPSAFRNSFLREILGDDARQYIDRLPAAKKQVLIKALHQRLTQSGDIAREARLLTEAVRRFGNLPVEDVALGYRGIEDKPADQIDPMMSLPEALRNNGLPPRNSQSYANQLQGGLNV